MRFSQRRVKDVQFSSVVQLCLVVTNAIRFAVEPVQMMAATVAMPGLLSLGFERSGVRPHRSPKCWLPN